MKPLFRSVLWSALGIAALPSALHAWGHDGHVMVNEVALATLPADFPSWIHDPATAERILFLANEPDRWRNGTNKTMLHATRPDHQIDWESLADAGIDAATLTPFRDDFIAQFAVGRAAHAGLFRPENPQTDPDHIYTQAGFLPWTVEEYFGKVELGFSELKEFEQYGDASEVANARANLIYVMGVMGHFVGDGCQPLHVTKHFNGWFGPNPNGYMTKAGIHGWIDSGFIVKAGIGFAELLPGVKPAQPLEVAPRPDGRDPVWLAVLDYLAATNRQVEPLYQLEKDGPLRMYGAPTAAGRGFIDAQILRGGEMLGALWLTAWRHAGPDTYLQSELVRRNSAAHPAGVTAPAGGG
jgi:hypothetical protein